MDLRKLFSVGGSAAILAGLALVLAAAGVQATPPDNHKVAICHFTSENASHPYNYIEVDIASSGYLQGGHDEHAKDIIPPYTYGEFHHPGQGDQAVLNNHCQAAVVEPTPTPSPTATPTPAPTGTPTPTPTATPRPEATATPGATPTATPQPAAVSATPAPSPLTTGAVLGESLAATGGANLAFTLGVLLLLGGGGALALSLFVWRRQES